MNPATLTAHRWQLAVMVGILMILTGFFSQQLGHDKHGTASELSHGAYAEVATSDSGNSVADTLANTGGSAHLPGAECSGGQLCMMIAPIVAATPALAGPRQLSLGAPPTLPIAQILIVEHDIRDGNLEASCILRI